MGSDLETIHNLVEKVENAGNQRFPLFSQYFQRSFVLCLFNLFPNDKF